VPVQTERRPAGRFPVQYVIRHQSADYRGYAGTIASGHLEVGDPIVVLPSGQRSTIAAIDLLGRPAERATAGQAATLLLADELDVSRGDLIAPAEAAPAAVQDVVATVCHLSEKPLNVGDRVLLKHTTRTVKAIVKEISAKLDISDPLAAASSSATADAEADEFAWDDDAPTAHTLHANDIGRVVLRTASPILLEPYAADRETGSFLLIDPASGDTLTAGMSGDPLGVFS
jgi:sulfate adenylyltransferase subunit 1